MAIWDLPEQHHPVHGRKSKRTQRRERREPDEQDMTSGANQMVKTASDFMVAGMGMAVISNMGGTVISALSKK